MLPRKKILILLFLKYIHSFNLGSRDIMPNVLNCVMEVTPVILKGSLSDLGDVSTP